MLEFSGFEVEDAQDGKIGMRLHNENPADLIITDIFMPEKEGIETILELKRDFPDLKIIAMSGGGSLDPEGYLSMAKTIGADRIFEKPFNLEDLVGAVKDLLK
jgi:DNA-binding response OmpR family regulator